MGVYLYIVKASLSFKAIHNGNEVKVAVAPYACRDDQYGREEWCPKKKDYVTSDLTKKINRKFTAIEKAIKEGFDADYVIMTSKENDFDGCTLYKYNKGKKDYVDCNEYEVIGTVVKIGNKYEVVDEGYELHQWIKYNHPNAYYKGNHCMYQRIHEDYKATFYCLGDLERYLNEIPNDIDLEIFRGYGAEQRFAPNWMAQAVQSLKREFINKHKTQTHGI